MLKKLKKGTKKFEKYVVRPNIKDVKEGIHNLEKSTFRPMWKEIKKQGNKTEQLTRPFIKEIIKNGDITINPVQLVLKFGLKFLNKAKKRHEKHKDEKKEQEYYKFMGEMYKILEKENAWPYYDQYLRPGYYNYSNNTFRLISKEEVTKNPQIQRFFNDAMNCQPDPIVYDYKILDLCFSDVSLPKEVSIENFERRTTNKLD